MGRQMKSTDNQGMRTRLKQLFLEAEETIRFTSICCYSVRELFGVSATRIIP
jgi:hypothetical protein